MTKVVTFLRAIVKTELGTGAFTSNAFHTLECQKLDCLPEDFRKIL